MEKTSWILIIVGILLLATVSYAESAGPVVQTIRPLPVHSAPNLSTSIVTPRMVPGPDLQADRVWIAQYVPPASLTQYIPLAGNPRPGQEVYLVCEFHDPGTNLSGSWRVSWQIDGKEVYTSRFGNIEARGKRNPAARYVIPASGAHRLECVLDPDGQIAETNEANNRIASTFQVASVATPGSTTGTTAQTAAPTKPDLKVTRTWLAQYSQNVTQYVPLSTNPIDGQQVFLVCEFENAGADLKGAFRLAWLVDGTQVATTRFGDMSAGMKRNPAGKYTVSVTPGSHKYDCVLDADNEVAESNDQNNRAGIGFVVAHGAVAAPNVPNLASLTPTGTLVNGRLYITGSNFGSIPGSSVVIRLQNGEQFMGVPDDVTSTKFSMAPVPDVYKGYNVTAKNAEHRARIQQLKTLYVKKGSTESNRLSFNIRSPYPILDQVYNSTANPGDIITVRGGNYEPAKITQYTAEFEYLPGKIIQTKLMASPSAAPPIPFPYLPDVTMAGNFLIKVPDVFAGKSQADQDAINRYTGTVTIFAQGTGRSNKLPFGFRKQTSSTSSTSATTSTSTSTGNTCQAGKYISGMTYVGRPGCATQNRADHPSAYLMCDASGFYCCESSQGANTKCGANRWTFPPDCGNFCNVGGCDVQLIQPYGCYKSIPR